MKAVLGFSVALGFATLAVPALADDGWWRLDRFENRVDRRESIVDRQTDFGRRDVVEDYYDRLEGRADRRNVADFARFDAHERRTARWKLLAH